MTTVSPGMMAVGRSGQLCELGSYGRARVASMINTPVGVAQFCNVPPGRAAPAPRRDRNVGVELLLSGLRPRRLRCWSGAGAVRSWAGSGVNDATVTWRPQVAYSRRLLIGDVGRAIKPSLRASQRADRRVVSTVAHRDDRFRRPGYRILVIPAGAGTTTDRCRRAWSRRARTSRAPRRTRSPDR